VVEPPRRSSGLLLPGAPALLTHRARTRTVTLPNGQRAKVTTDDSGTVTHVEYGERVDAIVRPRTVTIQLLRAGA
jgi:hypothetical protein